MSYMDLHVNKIKVEIAQGISTYLHTLGYRPSDGIMHPVSAKRHFMDWMVASPVHLKYLLELGEALIEEHYYRYDNLCEQTRKVYKRLRECCASTVNKAPKGSYPVVFDINVPPTQIKYITLPSGKKIADPVLSYRNYYMTSKRHIANWTRRPQPDWWK